MAAFSNSSVQKPAPSSVEVVAAVQDCGLVILEGRAALQVKVGGFRLDDSAANARMEENTRQATYAAVSRIAEAQKRLFDLAVGIAQRPALSVVETLQTEIAVLQAEYSTLKIEENGLWYPLSMLIELLEKQVSVMRAVELWRGDVAQRRAQLAAALGNQVQP